MVARTPTARPIRVLVVDDSALIRKMLREMLDGDSGIEVVGTASDPLIARDKIKTLKPDVLTLDIEMPRMDGLSFLENIMRLRPMPVVMVSTLTERGAAATLDALELGAVDFIAKPRPDADCDLEDYAALLVAKVKAAAGARLIPRRAATADTRYDVDAVLAPAAPCRLHSSERLLVIGASAGGTEAVRHLLETMPADAPGIVIAQHIPAAFSAAFAERLDRYSAMSVCEAQDGQPILPGHAYVAPGGLHLSVLRSGGRWQCRVAGGVAVNRHKPSVDVLMRSAAQHAGANAIGVILTGMGNDGARGLLELRQAGARTLVQDEATSVVWGMPGAAVRLDAAEEILPLQRIAARMLELALHDVPHR